MSSLQLVVFIYTIVVVWVFLAAAKYYDPDYQWPSRKTVARSILMAVFWPVILLFLPVVAIVYFFVLFYWAFAPKVD